MDQIRQVLQSYFYFRGAVLRKLEDCHFSKVEFKEIFGHDSNSIYRRRNNASLWKPSEIHNLALRMGIWDGAVNRLHNLADLIDQLPTAEKKTIYKVASLSQDKLLLHNRNPNSWMPKELEKIQLWCTQSLTIPAKTRYSL